MATGILRGICILHVIIDTIEYDTSLIHIYTTNHIQSHPKHQAGQTHQTHYNHQARQTHQTHPKHQARRTHQTGKLSTTVNHPKPSSAPDLIPAPVSVRAHVGLHCASGSTRYPRRLLSLLGRGVPLLRRHRCPSQKESKTGWNETLMTSVYSTQT